MLFFAGKNGYNFIGLAGISLELFLFYFRKNNIL